MAQKVTKALIKGGGERRKGGDKQLEGGRPLLKAARSHLYLKSRKLFLCCGVTPARAIAA